MRQRDIWLTDLNPATGSEQAGVRPIVIISGNMLNEHLEVVIACPLTSQIKRYKGNVIVESNADTGLKVPSEILTFHVRSISKKRLIKKVGQITESELEEVKRTLDDILRY